MKSARTDPALAAESGRRVRSAREAASLTQEELAEMIGVHRTYPGTVERGEVGPTLTSIVRFAHALKIDPADLVRGMHPSKSANPRRPRRRA